MLRQWIPSPALKTTKHVALIRNTRLPHRRAYSSPSPSSSIQSTYPRELFEYTSGRWIYNEALRLAERRLVFNVPELIKAVAESVNQPVSNVVGLVKLGEGGYNRVFELQMTDGSTFLARLPYLSTQPKGLAVASEVATLDFIRSHGIPAPKVLDYSANADNPVGAEYIIMEKLQGQPLGERWYELSAKERIQVTVDLVRLEAKLFAMDLPASGSLFYSYDVPSNMGRVPLAQHTDRGELCVGPDVSLRWWFEKRSSLEIPRGPYSTPTEVLSAAAEKELAWLRLHGRARYPFDRAYRESFGFQRSNPLEHEQSIRTYLDLVPHLVPLPSELHKPTLRHPDLQPNNIFVSEDLNVVGLIDWQHCSILPLFLAAEIPKYFQNNDDEQSLRFTRPEMPEGLDEMEEHERAAALELYRRRHLHYFYLGCCMKFNEPHYQALDLRGETLRRKLFSNAGEPWEGNNIALKSALVLLMRCWNGIMQRDDGTVPPCPLSFTDDEAEATMKIQINLEEVDSMLGPIREGLAINSDGWTSHDQYDAAMALAKQLKQEALEMSDEHERPMLLRHWPFDDHDENE